LLRAATHDEGDRFREFKHWVAVQSGKLLAIELERLPLRCRLHGLDPAEIFWRGTLKPAIIRKSTGE
jgi:hypothetical protein